MVFLGTGPGIRRLVPRFSGEVPWEWRSMEEGQGASGQEVFSMSTHTLYNSNSQCVLVNKQF